jgi:hypothetical protein
MSADGPVHTTANKNADQRVPEQQEQEVIESPSPFLLPAIARKARLDPRSLKPADILHVQRTLGNQAVQRLLADSAAPMTRLGLPDTLQRQPRRVSTVQEAIDITTSDGPTIDPRWAGNFSWSVRFRLPVAATNEGFIIQKCRTRLFDRSRRGGPLHDINLWEAWRIAQDMTTPMRLVGGHGDDQYEVQGTSFPEHGESRIDGIVCFYEGPLPPEFGMDNGADYFPQISNQPTGWTGRGTPHSVTFTWDRRTGRPPSDCLVANAGGNITQVGDCGS